MCMHLCPQEPRAGLAVCLPPQKSRPLLTVRAAWIHTLKPHGWGRGRSASPPTMGALIKASTASPHQSNALICLHPQPSPRAKTGEKGSPPSSPTPPSATHYCCPQGCRGMHQPLAPAGSKGGPGPEAGRSSRGTASRTVEGQAERGLLSHPYGPDSPDPLPNSEELSSHGLWTWAVPWVHTGTREGTKAP